MQRAHHLVHLLLEMLLHLQRIGEHLKAERLLLGAAAAAAQLIVVVQLVVGLAFVVPDGLAELIAEPGQPGQTTTTAKTNAMVVVDKYAVMRYNFHCARMTERSARSQSHGRIVGVLFYTSVLYVY